MDEQAVAAVVGVLLDRHAGVVRDARGLATLLAELARLEAQPLCPAAADRLLVARLIAAAALARTESRGAHFRTDFPRQDPRLAARLVQRLGQPAALEPLTLTRRGAA